MVKRFSDDANTVLDDIIRARRTIRAFREERPSREMIEQLLRAGLQAPYAALAVAGRADFRRFFVFTQGTPALAEAGRFIQQAARKRFEEALRARGRAPVPEDRDFLYMDRLKALAENGHPSLKTAPYFIVVGEYQGVPPAGLQSLAHTLENMWIRAGPLSLHDLHVLWVQNIWVGPRHIHPVIVDHRNFGETISLHA
jgi:hypothetical protein